MVGPVVVVVIYSIHWDFLWLLLAYKQITLRMICEGGAGLEVSNIWVIVLLLVHVILHDITRLFSFILLQTMLIIRLIYRIRIALLVISLLINIVRLVIIILHILLYFRFKLTICIYLLLRGYFLSLILRYWKRNIFSILGQDFNRRFFRRFILIFSVFLSDTTCFLSFSYNTFLSIKIVSKRFFPVHFSLH